MKVQPTMGSAYSGSLRGITASHNKGGLYFRGRTVPTNPNTARQQAIRSVTGGLTQDWSDMLTEAQRQAWRDYAANVPVMDKLGNSINLSGINWFIKSIAPRKQANEAGLSTVPVTLVAPTIYNTGVAALSIATFEGVFTTPPGTLTLTGTLSGTSDDDGDMLLYIAPPQTNGTRFYKGPYQLAATTAVASGASAFAFTTIDLSSAWISDTVPVAGWDGLYIPIRLKMLFDDNRISQELRMLVQFTDATP